MFGAKMNTYEETPPENGPLTFMKYPSEGNTDLQILENKKMFDS